jgi:hypothetical protein
MPASDVLAWPHAEEAPTGTIRIGIPTGTTRLHPGKPPVVPVSEDREPPPSFRASNLRPAPAVLRGRRAHDMRPCWPTRNVQAAKRREFTSEQRLSFCPFWADVARRTMGGVVPKLVVGGANALQAKGLGSANFGIAQATSGGRRICLWLRNSWLCLKLFATGKRGGWIWVWGRKCESRSGNE